MSYDVFISYSMNDSSWAYDLSAQLGRRKLMCYLDCVESGFTTSEYIKRMVEESQLFVVLAGEKLASTPYAQSLLRHAIETHKTILACPTDNTALTEKIAAHATLSTRETIVADIERLISTADSAKVKNTTHVPTNEPANKAEAPGLLIGTIDENKKREEKRKEEKADQEILETLVSTILSYSDETEETDTKPQPKEYSTRTKSYTEHRGNWKEQMEDSTTIKKVQKEETNRLRLGCLLLITIILAMGRTCSQCASGNEKEKTPLELHYEKISIEDREEGERLNRLGLIHFEGRNDVRMDRKKGLEYFVRAAELGNVEGMYNAGVCYKMTCRAELSEEYRVNAAIWLYKATVAGHEKSLEKLIEMAYWGAEFHEAKNNLAICYNSGYGTSRDMEKAIYWYKEAANDGNVHAMSNLAYCYYYGNGVAKDHKKALYYFEQAASKGLDKAKEAAEKLKNGEKL